MREPNFSESQLQQAVNTELIRKVVRTRGDWVFAHVPSLVAEFDLGWDVGFYFPWLSNPPSPDDEGCNLFLQYKLSGELTSAGAREWSTWKSPYFRFKIPHSTRTKTGTFIDDYHQWVCLNKLAAKSYPTFYVTNATLFKADVQSQYSAGTLLMHVPALDVRKVSGRHKHVTFKPDSSHFVLHSEEESSAKVMLSQVLARVEQSDNLPIRETVERLVADLHELPRSDESWNSDLARLTDSANNPVPPLLRSWGQYFQIANFVRKHLDVHLLWVPNSRRADP